MPDIAAVLAAGEASSFHLSLIAVICLFSVWCGHENSRILIEDRPESATQLKKLLISLFILNENQELLISFPTFSFPSTSCVWFLLTIFNIVIFTTDLQIILLLCVTLD